MGLWTQFVDVIYETILGLAVIFGGNLGLAIGVVSLTVRLALLPLTLRFAYRALETQLALKKLEPELAGIRNKYKNDPRRTWEETAKLHQRHGIKLIDGTSLLGTLVQVPVFFGLFAAVRRGLSNSAPFLWIRDLSKPDALLAVGCAALTAAASAMAPTSSEHQKNAAILLPAALTLVFLWRIAAGVTIYTFASSLVGVTQSLLVRRHAARLRALA